MDKDPKVSLPSDGTLEIRVHGRGGQGGVTCAKLIAAVYAELGLFVQTFGDYGSERSGAPVRAYTRVSDKPITNRNKVYTPQHLLVLDAALVGGDVLDGATEGAVVLVNSPSGAADFGSNHPLTSSCRLATVNATAIARRFGIGTSSVVITNTTIVGAYAHVLDLPMEAVEQAYAHLGLTRDVKAALEAYETVEVREPLEGAKVAAAPTGLGPLRVVPLPEHVKDIPTPLKTGSWRSQMPLYQRHVAPCNTACPAGNDVVGFIQALKNDGVEAAARILFETQPFPSVCGRVCPAFCMNSCNRAAYDGEVNIRGLERWTGDHTLEVALPAALAARPHRIAVVGGGPAGLSAAYALARKGHRIGLYEKDAVLGGVLRTGIPSYRLPPESLERDIGRILALGIEAHTGEEIDGEGLEKLRATHEGVLIATGLGSARKLSLPGFELSGSEDGLAFLSQIKADEGIEREALSGHVVVVGGGNSAIDCARSALRCGAERVTIVYRRSREEMPAIVEEISDALEEGVTLLVKRQPVGVIAAEDGKCVAGLELAQIELGQADASGRRTPKVTDHISRLKCDHILWALGQEGGEGLLPEGWNVKNGKMVSAQSGAPVFLAGDAATGDGTVTHAIGNGRKVAAALLATLDGQQIPVESEITPEMIVTPAHIRYTHFEVREPNADRRLSAGRRLEGFAEVNRGLGGVEEASRCFSCGRCTNCDTCLVYCPEGIIKREGDQYVVDEDYCKGCGMCVAECPREAMEMVADEAEGG